MLHFKLKIRLVRNEPTHGERVAWLIPRGTPDDWLAELARWDGCHDAARLVILPNGEGLLVLLREGRKPPEGAPALAYQAVGRLYFPIDSQISPPLGERDVKEWFGNDIAVFHPATGLVRCAESDLARMIDLLASPEVAAVTWNQAQPGNVPSPRLMSVQLAHSPEEVTSFLNEGKGDIGKNPIAKIPSYADEPRDSLRSKASRAFQHQLYKTLEKIGNPGVGRGSTKGGRQGSGSGGISGGGLLSRMGKWASRRLAGIESVRQRELSRLVEMLKSDPDSGLRFAPPLSSRGSRGRAEDMSDSLIERDTEFSLQELGRGDPASPWSVGWETYEALRREYREAANRELRLQRYRRAAYIFANLLDDFLAAADALKQGRHFREAALLYRDHARRPVDAAECFWEAGAFDEAGELFAEHGKFERLGELYSRIDRLDASRKAYRKAADHAFQMNNLIKASTILVDHLGEVDQALNLLRGGWPFSEQAKECVQEEFALFARQGRHSEAVHRLTELVDSCPSRRHLGPPLIESLGSIAEIYPAADVRKDAADRVRVETGRRIRHLSPREASRVLAVVRTTAPDDRLLLRDTQRFLSKQARSPLPGPPPRPDGAIDLKLFNILSLPNDATWHAVESFPGGYYAAGLSVEDSLVLIRKRWLGRKLDLKWPYPYSGNEISLSVHWETEDAARRVHIDAAHPLPLQSLELGGESGSGLWTAGSWQRRPEGYLGLKFSPTGSIWDLSVEGDSLVLKCYGLNGELVSTAHTTSLFGGTDNGDIQRKTAPVPMAVIDDQVFFAFRSFLCRYHAGDFAWLELPDHITDLQGGAADGQPILAAAMEEAGVGLISCGSLWGVWEHHAPNAAECRIRFLHDGILAVGTARLVELYRINPVVSETKCCAREQIKLPNLLGIVPGDEPDVVVLMTSLQSHFYRMTE